MSEFFDRLPRSIGQHSASDDEGIELYRSRPGKYYVDTGDPCCDVTMSWDSWVAFARQIIAADEAARAGGGE